MTRMTIRDGLGDTPVMGRTMTRNALGLKIGIMAHAMAKHADKAAMFIFVVILQFHLVRMTTGAIGGRDIIFPHDI